MDGPDPRITPPRRAAGQRLTDSQRRDWLRLIRTENVGPSTFRELINHFGCAAEALRALPELSIKGGRGRPVRIASADDADAELARADRCGARLAAVTEDGYPPWLAMVDAPPPLIYVKGQTRHLARPTVAIVGARNGSAIGQKFTRVLAADLGSEGFVIASGLARGIDTAAHKASLNSGTVAVLAGGLDVIYPPENAELHAAIGETGVLLSERPPGFQPRGQDFPRRNRLISGLSVGVVVIEAARRSGSLITARLAGEQGREVFAVPGNPLDPRAEGTNRLLKQGAGLVTDVQDIVSVLAPILGHGRHGAPGRLADPGTDPGPRSLPSIDASDRERVVEALGHAPVDIDEIARTTDLPVRAVHVVLLELDLAGRLERHGRQLVSLQSRDRD